MLYKKVFYTNNFTCVKIKSRDKKQYFYLIKCFKDCSFKSNKIVITFSTIETIERNKTNQTSIRFLSKLCIKKSVKVTNVNNVEKAKKKTNNLLHFLYIL